MLSQISLVIGRFLLGLYFFLPGLRKFTAADETVAYMQSHDIPFALPLLWFAGAASLVGGIALMTGRHVKFAAFGFVVYVILVNMLLHNFWAMEGDIVARETQNFVKNLAIMAGLLVLAGQAPLRRLQVQGFWRSDSSINRNIF